MTVKIKDGCISCGLCISTCPEVFRMGDEGIAEVREQPASPEDKAGAETAAENCPVSVIITE